MLPEFDEVGNLPVGIHGTTWEELEDRFGTNTHRKRLLKGMKRALISLRDAGCGTVYIDGSFVTGKEFPNDFDVCWDPINVDANLLDPVLLLFDNGRAAQKSKYFGELIPNIVECNLGITFLEFFQVDKNTGISKGIVSLELGGLK